MKKEVDLIVTNAKVYTVNSDFSVSEAFAVKDHRFVAVGTNQEITRKFRSSGIVDLQGKNVYPGWTDAHCHFNGYGYTLKEANLVGTSSTDEIILQLTRHYEKYPDKLLTGRGWDQNDWVLKEFPDKRILDKYFNDIPVILRRIDGHAAWVNSKALEMAGITKDSKIEGGDVILKNGEPSGILIDNAIGFLNKLIPPPSTEDAVNALLNAQKNCFAVGLTSIHDAGLSKSTVELIDTLQKEGSLKMRINVMLDPSTENIERFVKEGPFQNDYLTIGTIKLYADGALGSRGALMIDPYSDAPSTKGLLLTPEDELMRICKIAFDNNYQVATHCIGDGGNRIMLNIYRGLLGGKNDRRWRIEHAQIINPEDMQLFGEYNIIPSIQSTHATSDMYWAEDRIGEERMKGAYAYLGLLKQNGWLPNGSDFPVEDINPLYGFYASVVRKDFNDFPENGFLPENRLSREDALKSMTIWAAMSAFEEEFKGSIDPGKLADFVVTDRDIMTVPEKELYKIKVIATYSGGEPVYQIKDKR